MFVSQSVIMCLFASKCEQSYSYPYRKDMKHKSRIVYVRNLWGSWTHNTVLEYKRQWTYRVHQHHMMAFGCHRPVLGFIRAYVTFGGTVVTQKGKTWMILYMQCDIKCFDDNFSNKRPKTPNSLNKRLCNLSINFWQG